MKLNAKQLRSYSRLAVSHSPIANSQKPTAKNDIYIVLDNVLDTYNIGSIFRLADAIAAKKIYLCGGTETPPNHRIKKASINTTEWVEWEYAESALDAIRKVKDLWNCHPERSEGSLANASSSNELRDSSSMTPQNDRGMVVAIEQSKKSVQYDKFNYKLPICLVVGNETYGVSKEVLKLADAIVEIPMFGVNISLNVMVSLGIVLYKVVEKCLP